MIISEFDIGCLNVYSTAILAPSYSLTLKKHKESPPFNKDFLNISTKICLQQNLLQQIFLFIYLFNFLLQQKFVATKPLMQELVPILPHFDKKKNSEFRYRGTQLEK